MTSELLSHSKDIPQNEKIRLDGFKMSESISSSLNLEQYPSHIVDKRKTGKSEKKTKRTTSISDIEDESTSRNIAQSTSENSESYNEIHTKGYYQVKFDDDWKERYVNFNKNNICIHKEKPQDSEKGCEFGIQGCEITSQQKGDYVILNITKVIQIEQSDRLLKYLVREKELCKKKYEV